MRSTAGLLTPLFLLAACSDDAIVVTVDVLTDFEPVEDFALIFTEIASAPDATASDQELYRAQASDSFIDGVRVAELSEIEPGSASLRVRLEQLDGTVVGEKLVTLDLTASFAVTVTMSSLCPTGTEPGCGCETDTECASADVGCLAGRCVDGDCLPARDQSRCGADEVCDASGECRYEGACSSACDRSECAGERCDDGDACTHDDLCSGGSCVGTTLECESASCVVSACIGTDTCDVAFVPDGTACDDDANPCTADVCDGAGGCAHRPTEGAACADDGNSCTSDVCDGAGGCAHRPMEGVACADDGSSCTSDVCDASGACAHAPRTGASCASDDNPCTTDVCGASGACEHQALPDGVRWGSIYEHCCGGNPLTLTTDSDCGQCGATCQAGQACEFFMGAPTCRCTTSCPYGATCVFGWCACGDDSQCDGEARCQINPGHQFCTYD